MADCPYCLQPDALRFFWFVKCQNPGCPRYDEAYGAAQARIRNENRKGERRRSREEPAPADPGASLIATAPAVGPQAGDTVRTLRTVLGWLLLLGAAAAWLGDKSGHFKSGLQVKHLIWIGLAGFWILPRKPKTVQEEHEES